MLVFLSCVGPGDQHPGFCCSFCRCSFVVAARPWLERELELEGVLRLVAFDLASAVQGDRGGIWKTEQNADINRVSSAFALAAVGAADCLISADRCTGEDCSCAWCEGAWRDIPVNRRESHSQSSPDSVRAGNIAAACSSDRRVVAEHGVDNVGRHVANDKNASTQCRSRGTAEAGVAPADLITDEVAVSDVKRAEKAGQTAAE